jgi:DNA-binding transcriptional LysR family regulator
MLQEFRLGHPEVDLVLDEQVSTTQLEMLRADELDMAFIRPPLPDGPDIECTPLLREPMAVALPKGHRLTDRETLKLRQLSQESFIFFPRRTRPGLTGTVIRACEQVGFSPHTGQAAPQVTSAMRLVAAGAGIAIVPASLASIRMDGVEVRGLDHPWLCAEIALAMRKVDSSVLSSSLRATALRIGRESSGSPVS